MTELRYDVDPAHVATCTLPLASCRECATAFKLEAFDEADREVMFHQHQLTQARARRDRLHDRWEDWETLVFESQLD